MHARPVSKLSSGSRISNAMKPTVVARRSGSSIASAVPRSQVNKLQVSPVSEVESQLPRRALLGSMLMAGLATSSSFPASAGVAEVGSYLPPAGVLDLVKYEPGPLKTPGLRSGVVPATYSFAIPPKFVEDKIANIASGNFCLPNCGEPWTEAIYSSPTEGKLSLLVYPLQKLINKKGVNIEALGTPDQLLPRIGSYLTGTYLDEDEVISAEKKVLDDNIFYMYEVYAPAANGHSLSAMTVKGELAYLFLVSATDRQWSKSEKTLRATVESFRP